MEVPLVPLVDRLRAKIGVARCILLDLQAQGSIKFKYASKAQSAVLLEVLEGAQLATMSASERASLQQSALAIPWACDADSEPVLSKLCLEPNLGVKKFRRAGQDYLHFVNYFTEVHWAVLGDPDADMNVKKLIVISLMKDLHGSCPDENTYKLMNSFLFVVSEEPTALMRITVDVKRACLAALKNDFDKERRRTAHAVLRE